MQRRAAAIYAAFFILVAAGSYAMIAVAQEPTVALDDPDYSLSSGDEVAFDGRTYTVGQVQAGTNEGDSLRSTQLSWVNESARFTAEIENNSTVSAEAVEWQGQSSPMGEPYRLLVEDAGDPASFTLTQEFNVSARLAADPALENQTVTRADGERYVVYSENGSTRPLAEYLPAPETRSFAEGDTLQYQGNATTVADVTNETVTLAWTGAQTNSISLEEGGTTTLGGTEFVAHFPDNSTLALSADLAAYDREVASVETYHERINGFWGISILSWFAAVLLLAVAYLPSRY